MAYCKIHKIGTPLWRKECPKCAEEARQRVNEPIRVTLTLPFTPAELIEQIRSGQLRPVSTNVALHRGEVPLCVVACTLMRDQSTTRYIGGSRGGSVSLGHGIRIRESSYAGQRVTMTNLVKVDDGRLTVTSQRVVFSGDKESLSLPGKSILETIMWINAVELRFETNRKRVVFGTGADPAQLTAYIRTTMALTRR